MKNKIFTPLVAGLALLGAMLPATAMDLQIDEARFGGAILDIPTPDKQSYYEYNMAGINGEILFTPFDFEMGDTKSDGFLRELLTPRLHVGATISFDDHSPSSIYSGLTWHYALGEILFVEGAFGATLHDGEMDPTRVSATKWKRGLGSALLFREGLAIGANLTDTMNVVLQISHMSHAGLAGDNNSGQTDVALKLGTKF